LKKGRSEKRKRKCAIRCRREEKERKKQCQRMYKGEVE
jgi:hypothetical protein